MTQKEVSAPATKGETQIISPLGIPSTEAFGNPTVWQTYKFAPEWFGDALHEARTGTDHHARRREIIFSVCAAESYLLEWVRDEVLCRDFQKLNLYFPPGKKRSLIEKWKEIPKQLLANGFVSGIPNLNAQYWNEWLELIDYRNGLIHASSSRPETTSLPTNETPIPSKRILDELRPGWPIRVVVELISQLHTAVGTEPPAWLGAP